jgi:hypothetical protein
MFTAAIPVGAQTTKFSPNRELSRMNLSRCDFPVPALPVMKTGFSLAQAVKYAHHCSKDRSLDLSMFPRQNDLSSDSYSAVLLAIECTLLPPRIRAYPQARYRDNLVDESVWTAFSMDREPACAKLH